MFRECLIILFVLLEYNIALTSKSCKIPNGNGGTCTLVTHCDPLNELYMKKQKTPEEDIYIRQSVAGCGRRGSKVQVCCPPMSQWSKTVLQPVMFPETPKEQVPETKSTSLTQKESGEQNPEEIKFKNWLSDLDKLGQSIEVCGNDTSGDRIVGGNATEIEEFPWLAVLEYAPEKFSCGASLISTSHLLTAAHCLYTTPSKVRLSEYNLLTNPDYVELNGGGHDSISVVIIDVDWTEMHGEHQYMTSTNDIGIIKMKRDVQFGKFIKTICLPTIDYKNTDFTIDTKLIVAGWGSDNVRVNTAVKMSVYVPYLPYDLCLNLMDVKISDEEIICAGGKLGEDSCRGDSGGPLMYKDPLTSKFFVVGVVSSGPRDCGIGDKPGLYTNVFHYVDWIYKIMDKM